MAFERRFVLTLPFGICVGVSLPAVEPDQKTAPDLPGELHPEEAAFARALPIVRRVAWAGGRVALRAALARLDGGGVAPAGPILATARGAPRLPAGTVGSVSHKRTLAVALAARQPAPPATIGVDVEEVRPLKTDIAARVLTPDERAALPPSGPARDAAVLRAFSLKEAIYKALDPWVGRFVGFEEAAVARAPGGGLTATLSLKPGEGPFVVELHDAQPPPAPELILTAARVRPA